MSACQPSPGAWTDPDGSLAKWIEDGSATFSNERFPQITLPTAYLEDRQKYDARTFLPAFEIPSLFIGATQDKQVPAEIVRELHQLTGGNSTHLELDTLHTYCFDPPALRRIDRAIVDFFSETMGFDNA